MTVSETFALSTFVVSSPDRSDVMSLSETFALSTFIVRSPDKQFHCSCFGVNERYAAMITRILSDLHETWYQKYL